MPPTNYTTFRVRGIPAGLSREEFRALVGQAVSCEDVSGIRISSLACDPARPLEMIATVTFADIPVELSGASNEWSLEASDEVTLVLDTHFRGCTTLYCPPMDQWKSDLFAISGLNGHAFGSFKKKNGPYMWLCDSLPRDFPQCRITIYGYDTRLQGSRSFQNLLDIGKTFQNALRQARSDTRKPLILLGHSFGGIVIKEAIKFLRTSHIDADKLAFSAISGVIFFGVPNQGMNIHSLIPMVGEQPNRGFLHTLEHNSPVLRNQAEEFATSMAQIRCDTLNFYETQESPTAVQRVKVSFLQTRIHVDTQQEDRTWSMSGPPAVLVNTYSATHGRLDDARGHRVHPIDCSHSDLAKFSSMYDGPYLTVVGFLQDISEHGSGFVMTELEEGCFQSLGFCEQYQRMDSLEPAQDTCNWLTTHEIFLEWFQKPQGLLWIRGKPGSGKSMAMRHALKHVNDSTTGAVASFFLHGQGTELQRSILGIYRSILHQIYPHAPESFSSLTKRFEEYEKEAGKDKQDSKWSWMRSEIRQSLLEGLPKASKKHPIIVLIDALDEAGEGQARAIFEDMESLVGSAAKSACHLSVCLSCRHYPDIAFACGNTIVMEDHNSADIECVLESRLRPLDIFSNLEKNHVREAILARSNGIFQWTSLVTDNVVQMRQKGDSFQATLKNVDRVPNDLNFLYRAILEAGDTEEQELKHRVKLFQWVSFAAEPLSPKVLRHALALDSTMAHRSVHEYKRSGRFIRKSNFETKVHDLSRGLIEIKGSFNYGRVEFIHHSVLEFLAHHGGMAALSGPRASDPIRLAHFNISRSCLKYLFLREINNSLDSMSQIHAKKGVTQISSVIPSVVAKRCMRGQAEMDSATLKRLNEALDEPLLGNSEEAAAQQLKYSFPLISYAWRHWIFHAVKAKGPNDRNERLDDLDLLQIFHWPHDKFIVDFWGPLNGIIGYQLESWTRTFRPLLSRTSGRLDVFTCDWPLGGSRLVHLLALTGLLDTGIQQKVSSEVGSLEVKNFWEQSPLHCAIVGQQKHVIRNLISSGVSVQYDSRGQSPLHLASTWCDPEVIHLLLEYGGKVNRGDLYGRSPLHMAVLTGNGAAIRILVAAGAKTSLHTKSCGIVFCALLGSFLVGRRDEADTEACVMLFMADRMLMNIFRGQTPLLLAIERKERDVIRLLLELGADVNAHDSDHNSPLLYALEQKRLVVNHSVFWTHVHGNEFKIVRLLLQFGAEVNVRNKDGRTPLHAATAARQVDVVDLLLKAGANVNATNSNGYTPLYLATEKKENEITRLLVRSKADIYVGRGSAMNAMRFAIVNLNEGLLKLLLRSGADPNARDGRGETALFWIVSSRKFSKQEGEDSLDEDVAARELEDTQVRTIRLLLQFGADPTITSFRGRTARSYTARFGRHEVDKILAAAGCPQPNRVGGQQQRRSYVSRALVWAHGL